MPYQACDDCQDECFNTELYRDETGKWFKCCYCREEEYNNLCSYCKNKVDEMSEDK